MQVSIRKTKTQINHKMSNKKILSAFGILEQELFAIEASIKPLSNVSTKELTRDELVILNDRQVT